MFLRAHIVFHVILVYLASARMRKQTDRENGTGATRSIGGIKRREKKKNNNKKREKNIPPNTYGKSAISHCRCGSARTAHKNSVQ